jgi:ribose transport system ATP-binding protein
VTAIVGPGHAVLRTDDSEIERDLRDLRASKKQDVNSSGNPVNSVENHSSQNYAAAEPVLTMSRVSNDVLKNVDLTLHTGEIHGLAGLIGSGRTEILETIFGLRRVAQGDVRVAGKALGDRRPRDAIEQGIALVPEDRHVQGLVLDHAIERNLTLPRLPHFSRCGWLDQRGALSQARVVMHKLAVKAPSTATIVKNLSGGNQQKVVFAKWQEPRPRVLLLDEPTIGVDVGAREEIYGLVRDAANAGTAVLIVSSDLAELLRLCDRISIVADGTILETVDRDALDGTEALHHLIQLPRAASSVIQ